MTFHKIGTDFKANIVQYVKYLIESTIAKFLVYFYTAINEQLIATLMKTVLNNVFVDQNRMSNVRMTMTLVQHLTLRSWSILKPS